MEKNLAYHAMIDVWVWLTFISRGLIYFSTAIAIGGSFSLVLVAPISARHKNHLRYCFIGSLLGLITAGIGFFIQVGAFVDSGIAGMFDREIIEILLSAGIGTSLVLQSLGFFLILFALFIFRQLTQFNSINLAMVFIGSFCIAYSYSLTGHAINHGILARFSVFLHVLAMSLWIGSLYPLSTLCRVTADNTLQELMRRFSFFANFLVVILLAGGAYLLVTISQMEEFSFTNAYGVTLLVKLSLVVILLILAALNKWHWVPRLNQNTAGSERLRNSILLEIIVATTVLLTTAGLTTIAAA